MIKILWFSIFIPFAIGFHYFPRLTNSHRFLYCFLCIGVLTELSSRFLKKVFEIKNNMPLGHFYISISFIFIALFYLLELKGFINKKIIIAIVILFGFFSILNVTFFQSYYSYPSITGATSALLLVIFSIMLFTKIIVEGKIKVLSQSSLIWINTAILMYYSGNFFFYALYNIILSYSREFTLQTINFFAVLNVIFYTLMAVGFWKAGKYPEDSNII